jgi:hypothetical protein
VKVITLIDDPFLEIARVVSALRNIRASSRHCGCGYLSGGSDGGARDEVTSHDWNGHRGWRRSREQLQLQSIHFTWLSGT